MAEILSEIASGVAELSKQALGFAGGLAIAGTLSMAVLQIIKELTPLRRAYQRRWIQSWFASRAEAFVKDAKSSPQLDALRLSVPADITRAESMLIELSTGGEVNAFYDLAIEQLVAQMNTAAQIALEYPQHYFPLLAILSQGADIADLALVRNPTKTDTQDLDRPALDARNRAGHRIQRNLDGIQIALSSRWKFWMQATAIAFAVLFVEVAIAEKFGMTFPKFVVAALLGIIGGYLAPVTRDIVAALQSLRG